MQANLDRSHGDAKALVEAMPGLTQRQSAYLRALFEGKSKNEAAAIAGYANGSTAMRSPGVLAAVAVAADRYLLGELVPAALGVLQTLLVSDKTPEGVRASIGFGLLDRAGFDAKRHQRQAEQGKEANELSRDELRAAIDKLEQELEGRMKDVTPNGAPDSEPSDSLAIEFP